MKKLIIFFILTTTGILYPRTQAVKSHKSLAISEQARPLDSVTGSIHIDYDLSSSSAYLYRGAKENTDYIGIDGRRQGKKRCPTASFGYLLVFIPDSSNRSMHCETGHSE
jgi:hypothetical protein